MICAGKGARVIANIWNGSLDKRNICTMLWEKQTREQNSESKRKSGEKKKRKSDRAEEKGGRAIAMWRFLVLMQPGADENAFWGFDGVFR